jgi:hypothetical protein
VQRDRELGIIKGDYKGEKEGEEERETYFLSFSVCK